MCKHREELRGGVCITLMQFKCKINVKTWILVKKKYWNNNFIKLVYFTIDLH
jgi:hypothetical protein